MLLEIDQIKRWFGDNIQGCHYDKGRVIGDVPDGKYVIPIGITSQPFNVEVSGGKIVIGEKAGVTK